MTNGMTKGVLFLSAGNIHRAYGSKSTDQVRGAMRRLPLSGTLFLAGFLAITGSPPFGPFISEFAILNGAFDAGRFVVAGLFLFLLLVVFIGMGATVLKVVQGRPPAAAAPEYAYRDGLLTAAPVVVFMALVLLLGLYIPHAVDRAAQRRRPFSGGPAMTELDRNLAPVTNGRAIELDAVPTLAFDVLAQTTIRCCRGWPAGGRRCSAPRSRTSRRPQLYVVLADDENSELHVARREDRGRPVSFADARAVPQVHLFEREIAEQFGLQPDRAPVAQARALSPLLDRPRRLGPSGRSADPAGRRRFLPRRRRRGP